MSTLREPAHQVSTRAPGYWRTTALVGTLVLAVPLGVGYYFLPQKPWYATTGLVVLIGASLVRALLMPPIRFRIHRWEVTETAVHTRSGWLSREERIAPLSRVQTVDSQQSATMRLFGLTNITVTTASAAGPISVECLDADVAARVVAELTEITGQSEGDAT